MYKEIDQPSLEANKLTAKNMMDNGEKYQKAAIDQLDIEQQLNDSIATKKSASKKEKHLSSITWKTYAKVGANNALKGIPDFLKRGDIWSLLISSFTWHIMKNQAEIEKKGSDSIHNILYKNGELSLEMIEAIYTAYDQQMATTADLESSIKNSNDIYESHIRFKQEEIHAYNEHFIHENNDELRGINDFLINSRIDSIIVERSKKLETDTLFGASNLLRDIDWNSGSELEKPLLSPLELARQHYEYYPKRINLPQPSPLSGYGYDILIAGLVFLAFVAHKTDAQTTHNETHAKNDNVRTDETCSDRLFVEEQDRSNIKNLAELMGSLQLYYIRTRQELPSWLKQG